MRILRVFISIVCVCWATAGVVAAATPFDSLEPGQWMQIANNTIEDIDPEDDPAVNADFPSQASWHGVEGISAVMNDWNGGALATNYGQLGGFIAWGGGHGSYLGNEVYVFNIDTQLWERLSDPISDPDCNYTTGELQGGSPCSAHTYDYVDYHPLTNSFILLGSASNHRQGGKGAPRVHLFSLTSKQWRSGGDHPDYQGLTGASSAYDSNRDIFWLLPPTLKKLSSYDPNGNNGSGKWTVYNSSANMQLDALSAFDPVNDLLVTLSHRDPGKHGIVLHDLKNPNAGHIMANTTGNKALEFSQKGARPAFEYDPVSRNFVGWVGGTNVFTLTPPANGDWRNSDWVWTEIPAAASNTVDPGPPNRIYSRFRYVPALNAFILVNKSDGGVYLYKLNAGAGLPYDPPPAPPTDLETIQSN